MALLLITLFTAVVMKMYAVGVRQLQACLHCDCKSLNQNLVFLCTAAVFQQPVSLADTSYSSTSNVLKLAWHGSLAYKSVCFI